MTPSTNNDYFKDIAENLFQYRLSGFLCDTVLLTTNGELRAHSALLAAASPIFKAAMEIDLLHNVHYMRITELDMETVEIALSIMYTGRLVVPLTCSTTDQIYCLFDSLYKLGIERSTLANCQIELSRNAQSELTSELVQDLLISYHSKKDDHKTSGVSIVVIQLDEKKDDKEISLTKSEKHLDNRRKRKASGGKESDRISRSSDRKLIRVRHKKVCENVRKKQKRGRRRSKIQTNTDVKVKDFLKTDNSLIIIQPNIYNGVEENFMTIKDNLASSDTDNYSNFNESSFNADVSCKLLISEQVLPDKIRTRSNCAKSVNDKHASKVAKRYIARSSVKNKQTAGDERVKKTNESNDFELERENLLSGTKVQRNVADTPIDNRSPSRLFELASFSSSEARSAVRESSSLPQMPPRDISIELPTLESQESLTSTIKTENGEIELTDNKQYSCHVCGFVSKYRSNMTKHIRRHDGPTVVVRKFQCSLCSKAFGKNSHLVKHVRTHTGERPHKCSVCDRTFAERANMERHALMHSVIKPHLCELCGKGFIRKNFLADHVAVHHATKQTVQDCAKCGLTFTRRLSFVRHCLKVHGSHDAVVSGRPDESGLESGVIDREQDTTESQPMICDVCGKTFITLATLKSHARVHANHVALTCKMCSRTYSSLTNLRLHERSVHSSDKPHACTVCDKTFALKVHLNLHMVRHSGVKNYQCDVCLKGFVLRSSLQSHVKIHTTEKKFSCQVCNKSFKFQNTLTAHVRIHTGEKPYKCTHCAMSFKQNVHLTRHVRSHTGEKPYACEMCTRAYKNKIDLGYHYTRYHQVNRT